jgi:hypothetical protein
LGALALVAFSACKSAPRAVPKPDAATGAVAVECEELLPEAEVERACGGTVERRTATLGEGWELLPVCHRKFFTDRGGLGFRLHHLGDAARSRENFAREEARARARPGFERLGGVGEAAMRFLDRVARRDRPTLVFRRGAWTATLHAIAGAADGGPSPGCTFAGLRRMAGDIAGRLPR